MNTTLTPALSLKGRGGSSDVIVVEDRVDMQCVRHVHLMSNSALTLPSPDGRGEIITQEAGVWHYRAEYPFRGVIDIPAACREGKVRRLVAWSLEGCASVRSALQEAAREFERLFGGRARFGFVKKLPRGVESGMDIGDITLLEAEWMLERCVAVGGKTPLSLSTATSPQMEEHHMGGEKNGA